MTFCRSENKLKCEDTHRLKGKGCKKTCCGHNQKSLSSNHGDKNPEGWEGDEQRKMSAVFLPCQGSWTSFSMKCSQVCFSSPQWSLWPRLGRADNGESGGEKTSGWETAFVLVSRHNWLLQKCPQEELWVERLEKVPSHHGSQARGRRGSWVQGPLKWLRCGIIFYLSKIFYTIGWRMLASWECWGILRSWCELSSGGVQVCLLHSNWVSPSSSTTLAIQSPNLAPWHFLPWLLVIIFTLVETTMIVRRAFMVLEEHWSRVRWMGKQDSQIPAGWSQWYRVEPRKLYQSHTNRWSMGKSFLWGGMKGKECSVLGPKSSGLRAAFLMCKAMVYTVDNGFFRIRFQIQNSETESITLGTWKSMEISMQVTDNGA